MTKLTEQQIGAALKELPDWSEVGGKIQKTFQFADFIESMKFVNAIAEEAEVKQHHPDILIRYDKVTLTLTTHDAGGITDKDFALAGKSEAVAV